MDNFFTRTHTHTHECRNGGCRRIVIRRDWELWWNRGTIDRWKWKIGEHGVRRCFPIERWRFVAAVGKTRTCPPMSPFPSPIQSPRPSPLEAHPPPPLAQTILGPSPERKGWFVADCSTVTHILTRTFWHDAFHRETGYSRPLFLPSTYLPFEIKESM